MATGFVMSVATSNHFFDWEMMQKRKLRKDHWYNQAGRKVATTMKRYKRHLMRRKLKDDLDADLRQAKATEKD